MRTESQSSFESHAICTLPFAHWNNFPGFATAALAHSNRSRHNWTVAGCPARHACFDAAQAMKISRGSPNVLSSSAAFSSSSASPLDSRSQSSAPRAMHSAGSCCGADAASLTRRSEEHTSELQSRENLVCRLLHHPRSACCYTLSLHDALPISCVFRRGAGDEDFARQPERLVFVRRLLVVLGITLGQSLPILGAARHALGRELLRRGRSESYE